MGYRQRQDPLMVRACVVDASRDSSGTFLSSIGVLGIFECSSTCSDLESPVDRTQWQCHFGRYPHGIGYLY